MDFRLSDEQTMLRDTARALLASACPPARVRAYHEDPAATTPWGPFAPYAALAGAPATDAVLCFEEAGAVALPGPFLASVGLAGPLLVAADHPDAEEVVGGDAVATVAIAGPDGHWRPDPHPVKSFVLDADAASLVVVVRPGPEVLTVPAGAVARRPVDTVDPSRRCFEVDTAPFEAERGRPLDPAAFEGWADRATVTVAAELVGTARRLLAMAVDYARERVQFGRPIGAFQAIQHKLADAALDLERATAAVRYAAMTIDADVATAERRLASHVAKATAGAAARRATKDAIQVHGGIGYTWEHDLHLFLRRAIATSFLLGPADEHHDAIADALFSPI